MTVLAAICIAFSAGLYQFTFIAILYLMIKKWKTPFWQRKQSLQIMLPKGRVALPDPTIPYPLYRFLSLRSYWLSLLCAAISFDYGRDALYRTQKEQILRRISRVLKYVVIALFKYYFIIPFNQKGKY